MANKLISDLAAAAALTGAELIELTQSGGSVQSTVGAVSALSGAVDPEGAVTAFPGKTYLNTATEGFWVKKTGTGSIGWIQLIA